MDGLSGEFLATLQAYQPRAMPRRDRKAALYSLCAELAGCNVTSTHIARLLQSNVGYVIEILTELGLHRRRRDRSADEAFKRLPPDVRERIEAFRDRNADGKC